MAGLVPVPTSSRIQLKLSLVSSVPVDGAGAVVGSVAGAAVASGAVSAGGCVAVAAGASVAVTTVDSDAADVGKGV